MKRNPVILLTLIVAATLTVSAFYNRAGGAEPSIVAEPITRGSVVKTVAATGTLEAVTTVQVGSQVSGTVQALYADFNSLVRKGQVLVRLDPSLHQSAIEQAEANLLKAEADEQRVRVLLSDAESKLARARELSERQLIPANDLDAAEVNRSTIQAQVRSAAATVTQTRASLEQARVNLAKTVITSPIDGIVISRNVDVGQTVAASLSAPTLFLIAADLSQMQLNASVDESDLGQIREGQAVRFTVDAYPGKTFEGVVRQVRLNPVVTSNVVTYAAIISAPNPRLELKPGMTANLTVEVARRDDVLRVPAAALRFRPTAEVLQAFGAPPQRAAIGTVVWKDAGTTISAVPVKVGLSDGTWTELIEGGLTEGSRVTTRAALAGEAAPAARSGAPVAGNPLMGAPPRGR